uniref:TBC1 domain family member 2B n=1 Tax=Ditylenchus dipsaci TaxID=166011 RepID=A0A915EQN0_9BILA
MAAVQARPRRLSAQNGGNAGLLQLQIPSSNHHSYPHHAFFQPNSPKEEWFSLEGFLFMKCQGGALTFLQSKKRMYFGLEELENKLIYYRDKADFDRKKDCLGTIFLNSALCSLIEGNLCAFVLHTGGKKYIMEAENEMCAHCWLNALQQRVDINDNDVKPAEVPCLTTHFMQRHRSRSRSVPSESDSQSPESSPHVSRSNRRRPLEPLEISASESQSNFMSKAVSLPLPQRSSAALSACLLQCTSTKFIAKNRQMCVDVNSLDVVSIAKKNGLKSNDPHPPQWLENWINNWLSDQLHEEAVVATPTDVEELQLITSSKSPAGPSISVQGPSNFSENGNDVQEPRSEITLGVIVGVPAVDNRQKERIHELNLECTRLVREVERLKAMTSNGHIPNGSAPNSPGSAPDYSMAIAAQNRFLNSELLRINDRCIEADRQVEQCNKKIYKLETEMEDFKKEYVYLLQSCVRIPLHEHSSCDVVQVKLFGGDVHERRVKMLLERARESDPTLPSFESVTKSGSYHVDDYGFRHSFDDIPLALHYIATQLNEHYDSQSEEYIILKHKWRTLIESDPNAIDRNRENRHLCRLGVPRSLRSKVWRILINQQVAEIKSKYGEYYYRNLCSSQGTPAEKHYCANHQKQINLDLLRTMPSNVHFQSASCKGYILGFPSFHVLISPLFTGDPPPSSPFQPLLYIVSPEDAFWFLVAITERYFCPSYFDQSLTGAQADQEVLKEIVEQKFPKLSQHLEECDIDLTTITLNWFLALFF